MLTAAGLLFLLATLNLPKAEAGVYPEYKSRYGTVHWIKEQMPLKVYVSYGKSLDGIVDETSGVPEDNVDNLPQWPLTVARLLQQPNELKNLPTAKGFEPHHYQDAINGISSWKTFEKEGLFSFNLTDDPADADIFVFWVDHFVNRLGLGLFAGDIRGYTSKESFPYNKIMSGGRADFKPVVIVLRTTEGNGTPLPANKMFASAAHEFGHALGIEGHSRNPADLMSLYYGRGVISTDDAATIRYLYHQVPDLIP
jgi:predicted Zn-dependent protease